MSTEHTPSARDEALHLSGVGSGLLPGVLEAEHHRLMECRADTQGDDSLEIGAERLIDQLRQLGTTLEDAQQRRRCQKIADFWGIHLYRVARKEAETELLPFDPDTSTPLSDEQFPYHFQDTPPEDATTRLQGWRRLLDECEHCLVEHRLLAVVSDPGSGGKLLLHRMFVPRLKAGATRHSELAGSDHWQYHEVIFGDRPLHALLHALALANDLDQTWVRRTLVKVQADPSSVREHLGPLATSHGVIILRQANRLLTLEASQRQTVCEVLEQLVSDPEASWNLVLSMNRADATRLAEFQPLSGRLRNGHVLLAFTTAELRHLIVEPAQTVGLSFDPGLVDQLLIDIQGESTALPLLQFTLKRLWERRERNRITWDGYRHVGAGRVALSKAMDEIHQPLGDTQRKALRHILTTMVLLVPGGTFNCRAATRRDLADPDIPAEAIDGVLQQLLAADMVYEPPSEAGQFQLKYPALLSAWQPLVEWLEEARAEQPFRLRLRTDAERWQRNGRSDDLLWRGWTLQDAENRLAGARSVMEIEREFLTTGRKRERRKTLWRWVGSIAFVAMLLTIFVGVPLYQSQAEKRRRMLDNATESMRSKDITGELLWLNASSDVWLSSLNWFGGTENVEPQMRDLAELQRPKLVSLSLALGEREDDVKNWQTPDSGVVNLSGWPVSTDIHDGWVAVLAAPKPALGPNAAPYQVLVRSLKPSAPQRWTELTDAESSAGPRSRTTLAGDVRFLKLASGDNYLVAADEGLRAWRRIEDRWSAVAVDFVSPRSTIRSQFDNRNWRGAPLPRQSISEYRPHKTVVAGEYMATEVKDDAGQQSEFRLWRIGQDPSDKTLRCNEITLPDHLASESAGKLGQLIISPQGVLVALSGSKATQLQTIRVWHREQTDSNDVWQPYELPAWFQAMKEQKYQRVSNWGWEPSATADGYTRLGNKIQTACFAPDGNRFATACEDGQVLIWELSERKGQRLVTPLIESKMRLGSAVYDVTFLTENILATAGRDRTARFWNVHNGAEILPPIYHRGTVSEVAAGSPGWFLTLASGSVSVYDSDQLRQLCQPQEMLHWALDRHHHKLLSVPVDSSSKTNPEHILKEDHVLKEQVRWRSNGEENEKANIDAVALSPTGNRYAWLVKDASQGWQIHSQHWPRPESTSTTTTETEAAKGTDTKLGTIGFAGARETSADSPRLLFDPLERYLAVVPTTLDPNPSGPSNKASVQLYQLTSPASEPIQIKLPAEIKVDSEHTYRIHSFTINDTVFNGDQNGTALVLVGEIDYLDPEKQSHAQVGGVLLAFRDTSPAAGGGRKTPSPARWLVSAAEQGSSSFPHAEKVLCAGLSPGGRYLATGSAGDDVHLWDLETWKSTAGGEQGALFVKPTLSKPLDHSSDVVQLRFASDLDDDTLELATVSSEGEAILWSIKPGLRTSEERSKVRHEAKILSVEFSHQIRSGSAESKSMKQRWLITGSADRTARVWHPETGELVGVFLHEGPVVQASYLIDGDDATLATVSQRPVLRGKQTVYQLRFWQNKNVNESLDVQELQLLAGRKVSEDQMDLERLPLPSQPRNH